MSEPAGRFRRLGFEGDIMKKSRNTVTICKDVDGIDHEFEAVIEVHEAAESEIVSIKHKKGCCRKCLLVTNTYDLETFRELIEDSEWGVSDLLFEAEEAVSDYDNEANAMEHRAGQKCEEAFEYCRGLRGLHYD